MSDVEWVLGRIRGNSDAVRLVYEFNRVPQNWVHPEHLASVPHFELVGFLGRFPSGQERASRWVESQLGLSDSGGFWNFGDKRLRLALLGWQALELLARCVGSSLHAREIAALIGKNDIAGLRNALGREPHEFALRAGIGNRIPAVVSETARAWVGGAGDEAKGPGNGRPLAERIEMSGWGVVRSVLMGQPMALWRRFHFKIPARFHDSSIESGATDEHRSGCWKVTELVARRLLPPEELRCFD